LRGHAPSTVVDARPGASLAERTHGVGRSRLTRSLVVTTCFAAVVAIIGVVQTPVASAQPVGSFTVVAEGLTAPQAIAAGPDGNLWFTTANDAIGRITTGGAVSLFRGPGVSRSLGIAAGADGNMWFTNTYTDTIGRITPAGVISNYSDIKISYPRGITGGPDGNLWFTNLNTIGRITPAGVVSSFSGAGISGPLGITTGPDGNLWFTNEGDNSIGRITPAGVVTNYTGPGIGTPNGITAGPDGNLWFANTYPSSIGRVTPAGVVTSYTDATVKQPVDIAAGSDGNLWFTNGAAASLGRITPAGVISSLPSTGIESPQGITAGPDGNLWFTNASYTKASIGRMTTAGVPTFFANSKVLQPFAIVAGPDGNLWFTNSGNNSIGRVTPAGVVTNFTGTGIAGPMGITVGPDGNLWFANNANNSIGRVTLDGVVTNFANAYIFRPAWITAGPDGNLWFTNSVNGGGTIGRMSTTGVTTNFIGTGINYPTGITAGPDGNLWFTNAGSDSIGRITPTGAVSNFTGPGIADPFSITAGPDGNLWFTNIAPASIGRITPAGVLTTFPHPGLSYPTAITKGSDNNLWFVNSYSDSAIGRITPIGDTTLFAAPNSLSYGIAAGPDGNVWTAGVGLNVIGKVRVNTEPAAPTNVAAAAGNAQATVNWTAPVANGGSAITGYTATASPGGKTCTSAPATLSCTVTGLTNGQAYTFTVTATNSAGVSPPSAASAAVTPRTTPSAPTAVTATATNARAVATWSAPASDGGASITGYTVTASPGGASCTWSAGPLTCPVTGLTNGVTYTLSVTATNAVGTGPASVASNAVTPVSGTYFHPLAPVRILDSRGANGGWNAKLVAGTPRTLTVTGGIAGVPANADAVIMNVTATGGSTNSFLTVFPSGSGVPNVSNLNFAGGQTIPNLVTVKVGTNGQVSFANAAGTVDVIADVVGYYDTTPADRYNALPPERILDSRGTKGGWNAKLVAGAPKNLTVRGVGGVPATADAVIMNVTASGGSANSFLTAYPAGGSVPVASNVNFAVGETIPNLVVVKIGTNGQVSFANAAGAVDVIADVVGYFDAATGDVFHSITPARLLDSRGTTGGWNAKLNAGFPKVLTVTGVGSVTAGASAVVGNTTATGATANSFLTVFPAGGQVPNASNLNFAAGQTIPNLVAVKVGTNGQIAFANAVGATDVIFDVVGFYTPT